MTLSSSQSIQTDTWVKSTWDNFVAVTDEPQYEEGRGYFDNGYMRVEIAPLVAGHSRQNAVVMNVVSLFAALHNVRLATFLNCSFYKIGVRGCQPDVAFTSVTPFNYRIKITHRLMLIDLGHQP